MPRAIPRRHFLILLAGAPLLAACSGDDADGAAGGLDGSGPPGTLEPTPTPVRNQPTATPTTEPTSTPSPEPTPTITPVPTPFPQLDAPSVEQGGMLLLRVTDATAAQAHFLERVYALGTAQDGSLAAYLAVYQWDAAGLWNVDLTMTALDGAVSSGSYPVEVVQSVWVTENIDLPPGGESLLDPAVIEAEQIKIGAIYAIHTPAVLWEGAFLRPTEGIDTSPFGELRSFNGGPVSGSHGGADIANDEGTPIFASNRGIVVLAEPLVVRGNAVIVDHGAGLLTGYHHLSQIQAEVGQEVGKGQQVGLMGATGLVTGPHLHWEVAINGVLCDGLRLVASAPPELSDA